MKKIYTLWRCFRMLLLLLSIPLLVVELINPDYIDLNHHLGSVFGARTDYFCQVLAVSGELMQRIFKLRELKLP